MEYLHEVAQKKVGIHDGRFVVVVASGGIGAGVVVIDIAVSDAAGIGELRAGGFQFVECVRHADVQPHIGLRSEQVCLLQVDRRRRVARVLLVDVVASGVGNQPHGIVFRRGHEPRIAVGRIEHDRRGIENGTGHFLFQRIVSDRNIREYLFALRAFPETAQTRLKPIFIAASSVTLSSFGW